MSKEGFATRYWDCCKPSCSWPEHAGDYTNGLDVKQKNNKARMCTKDQKVIDFAEDTWAKSACDEGGYATTCLSQMPIIVNDNLAYGYAATPAGSDSCGRCFKLTFDGTGHWETTKGHKLLKGKVMIVIGTNVGHDVAGGQFDIMIPGGGVGMFNGCAGIFSGDMGKTYGGLLSDCEESIGYDLGEDELYTKRKECLTQKCKSTFSGAAQEGCLFHATWMEAAGNPNLDYEETECPQILKDNY